MIYLVVALMSRNHDSLCPRIKGQEIYYRD